MERGFIEPRRRGSPRKSRVGSAGRARPWPALGDGRHSPSFEVTLEWEWVPRPCLPAARLWTMYLTSLRPSALSWEQKWFLPESRVEQQWGDALKDPTQAVATFVSESAVIKVTLHFFSTNIKYLLCARCSAVRSVSITSPNRWLPEARRRCALGLLLLKEHSWGKEGLHGAQGVGGSEKMGRTFFPETWG